jgi:selenium metabolism protein YedF
MSEVVVDARGQLCPKPLILSKQALKDNIVGTQIVVLIDNETSCQNVARFLRDNGMAPHIAADGSEFILRFTKSVPELAAPDAAAYCVPARGASWVMTLTADTLGRGPAELGARLMQGLLATLEQIEHPPSHLVLYSSAALLAAQGSPHLDSLRAIERCGIAILICGMCVDYYEKRAEIAVGEITNMLVILETMAHADKVVTP